MKLVRIVTASLLAAVVGAPLFAAEPAPSRPLRNAIASATAPSRSLRAQTAATPDSTSSGGGSFFKSRRGAIVAVLMIGASAYVVYSRSHDRVRSPIN